MIQARLRDTMYSICVVLHFSHVFDTEKILADVLSLDPCNTVHIRSKIPLQIIFGTIFFFSFSDISNMIVSRLHDSIMSA